MVQQTEAVSHNQLDYLIEKAYRTKVPLFIWGKPGIGKSDTVRQTAKRLAEKEGLKYSEDVENDINREDVFLLIDIRLAQLEAVDLRGVPQIAKVKTTDGEEKLVTAWIPPRWFPIRGKGLLFFDEFNLAAPSIQAGAFEIVRDRRTGERFMSEGYGIIGAGNPEGSRYQSFAMSSPLLNRFSHVTLKIPDTDSWIEWALQHGLDSRIITFVKAFPSALFRYKEEGEEKAFPTPRTHEMLSIQITEEEELEIIDLLATSLIGFGTARELMQHIKLTSKIDFEDLFRHPQKIAEIDDIGLKWACLSGIVERYRKKPKELIGKVVELANNFKYPVDAEFPILLCRMCKNTDKQFINRVEKVKLWKDKLANKIGKFLL